MIIVLLWIALCFVVAYAAGQKGRSSGGFFFLSLFLSPLVGLLVLIAVPARVAASPAPALGPADLVPCHKCRGLRRLDSSWCPHCGAGERPAESKKCPMCAELIKPEALKCRFCGADQAAPAPTAGEATSRPHVARVASGMGYCPGCKKLRGTNTLRCVYCNNTEAVSAA